jgi:hypothetical protein
VDGSLELWFIEYAGTSKRAAEGNETGDMEAEAEAEDVMDGMWHFENGRRKVTWAAGKGSHKREKSSG